MAKQQLSRVIPGTAKVKQVSPTTPRLECGLALVMMQRAILSQVLEITRSHAYDPIRSHPIVDGWVRKMGRMLVRVFPDPLSSVFPDPLNGDNTC